MASSNVDNSHAKRFQSQVVYERKKKARSEDSHKEETPLHSSSNIAKEAQKEVATLESFDKEAFDSKEHEEAYGKLLTRPMCLERVFVLKEEDCFVQDVEEVCLEEAHQVYKRIKAQKWEYYCLLDKEAYESTITHFYANLNHLDKENPFSSYVFGKKVSFDPSTINSILKTPFQKGKVCALEKLMKQPIDMDLMLKTLCKPKSSWTLPTKHDDTHYLVKASFTPLARMWLAFVQNRLLPTFQKNKVTKKWVLATYCLVKKLPINIGLTIAKEILDVRVNHRFALKYGCLISLLCEKHGATYKVGLPLPKRKPVTKSFFHPNIFGDKVPKMGKNKNRTHTLPKSGDATSSTPSNNVTNTMLATIQRNLSCIHARQEGGLLLLKTMAEKQNMDIDQLFGKVGGFDKLMEATRFKNFSGDLRGPIV